jgi:RimJ/RimL family protein N-acetyltransferase
MQIQTKRLILREFSPDDWQVLYVYQNHPLYLRYSEWISRTPEDVRDFIQRQIDNQLEKPRLQYQLAITLKTSEELIGNCGILMGFAGTHEAEIGYELDPNHWKHGYATETARVIVDFCFTHLHLHRIWAHCVADNTGSAHVLEKLGLQLEGRQRDKEHYKDRYWDMLLYAVLRKEWQQQTKPVYQVLP